jgi:SagB-type dehydrogenase family enzyme
MPKGKTASVSGSAAARLEAVMRYHERTKHHFARFAPGPGQLDWANQPDPFRRFAGAPLVRLPRLAPQDEPRAPAYDSLYAPGAVPAAPPDLRALSRLLEYALALSAWKQAGGVRWALRANPSSGNLHPTEGYVLAGAMDGLGEAPGLYHYAPREHALERRADCPKELFARLTQGLAPGAVLVGLSAIYWREAWKYGERAFRYCQHDAGHALGALRIAAATLGWSARVLDDVADEVLAALLGLDRDADFAGAERESAELVMAIAPGKPADITWTLEAEAVQELRRQRWYGRANRLSADDPVRWEAIDGVAAASQKP